ncbi:MAG: hypothetical protein H6712_35225 [Myxococcales bacterium]|nr:hypothetical protein [Myxococcales bacterium]MCB9719148.1 hypothetical protein [Myxococcales bacterium]
MDRTERELLGHRVVIQPGGEGGDRLVILLDERRFEARLDGDLGWSCSSLPFRGYASPDALAEALAASFTAEPEA